MEAEPQLNAAFMPQLVCAAQQPFQTTHLARQLPHVMPAALGGNHVARLHTGDGTSG